MSASVNATIRTAIKSYFGVHDIMLNLPKIRKKRSEDIREDPPMALENFYKMLQNGKPGLMMRAVLLVKFQSGMDAATLTDRFNYDEYRQLVKWFGTEMHAAWNLGLCPVQITLVRVKTGMHTSSPCPPPVATASRVSYSLPFRSPRISPSGAFLSSCVWPPAAWP